MTNTHIVTVLLLSVIAFLLPIFVHLVLNKLRLHTLADDGLPIRVSSPSSVHYTGEFKSWRRNADIEKGYGPCLWIKCAVCDTTRVTLPWWKRVRYVRADKFETHYTPMGIRYNGTRIWGLCSDQCLNMFYLGN